MLYSATILNFWEKNEEWIEEPELDRRDTFLISQLNWLWAEAIRRTNWTFAALKITATLPLWIGVSKRKLKRGKNVSFGSAKYMLIAKVVFLPEKIPDYLQGKCFSSNYYSQQQINFKTKNRNKIGTEKVHWPLSFIMYDEHNADGNLMPFLFDISKFQNLIPESPCVDPFGQILMACYGPGSMILLNSQYSMFII